ncbi:MAG: GIY-YIG nuclease family protein [Saprospiraceae bacterium]|nr:GIY-YIG nuclease family protein [Saprospiraceae bacterium]
MFTVYVLKSKNADWFYVGMTSDFERRLSDHNRGYNLSTKAKAPLFYYLQSCIILPRKPETEKSFSKNASGKRFIREYFKKNMQ